MGMNQAGDGLVPISKEMGELLSKFKDRTDEEDLYGQLCRANGLGEPLILFQVGEKFKIKGHEWEVVLIGQGEMVLKPIRRL